MAFLTLDPAGVAISSAAAPGLVEPGSDPLITQTGYGVLVQGAALQPDGKVVIVGRFTSVGGVARNRVARVFPDGTLDEGFDPNVDAEVHCVAILLDGKILIGGEFSQVGGVVHSRLACLNADGTPDENFVLDSNVSGAIDCIALQLDGKILIGVRTYPYTTGRMVRLHPDGSLDSSFNEGSNYAHSILVQPDGKVVAAGGGTIRRVHADGSPDVTFAISGHEIYGLALQRDGKVLMVGTSTIRRFNPDGSVDATFTAPTPDAYIYCVTVQTDGKILIGGEFSKLNGTPHGGVARLLPDGAVDPDFVTTTGEVFCIPLQPDGKVIIVGNFVSVNQQPRHGFARLSNDAAAQALSVPAANELHWERTGAGPEIPLAIFEWSLDDGASWRRLGSATRVADGWELAGIDLNGFRGTIRSRGSYSTGFGGSSSPGADTRTFDFETFTVAPTLAAPSGLHKNPLPIDFTLPEAARSGSVRLIFTSSSFTRELVLGSAFQTQGRHVFDLDLTEQSLAELLSDGSYTVKVSYQDTTGHPTEESNALQTIIDTTPPTFTGPFSPLVVYAGSALPDFIFGPAAQAAGPARFPSDARVTDANGVASASQSPPPGTILNSTTHVILTATDNAGNQAVMEFDVIVRPTTPPRVASLVAGPQGDFAPGAGTRDGPPSGARLSSFGLPAIDDDGQIAYLGRWGAGRASGQALFTDLCLVKVGDHLDPGVPEEAVRSLSDPVIDRGRVASVARFRGGPAARAEAILAFDPDGTRRIAARGGDSATLDFAKFKSFKSVALAGDYLAFLAQLAPGTGIAPRTSAANDLGIWVKDGANLPRLMLREGQVLPALAGNRTIATLASFAPGNGSAGCGRGWLVELPDGSARVLARVTFKEDKSQAIVAVETSNPVRPIIISQTGVADNAASPTGTDLTFASLGLPAGNALEQTAFLGSLTAGRGQVTRGDARGIFLEPAVDGPSTAIARLGAGFAVDGLAFTSFKDPVLAADGGLAFPATVKGANVRGLAARTLWWQPPGDSLRLLAQAGVAAGGVPTDLPTGAQWKSFSSLAIAANRGPLFTGTLVSGKGGVTTRDAGGVWATDFNGEIRTLFRTNDPIDLGGGTVKTLRSFSLLKATVGNAGVTRSFNQSQQLVWLATFTDKSQAIVISEVP